MGGVCDLQLRSYLLSISCTHTPVVLLRVVQAVVSEKGVEPVARDFDESFKPRGTWAFVTGFAVLLFIMWFSVYLLLLSRGVTT